MSTWGVPDLSTRPRALRALGTRDKSDTPQVDIIQIERMYCDSVSANAVYCIYVRTYVRTCVYYVYMYVYAYMYTYIPTYLCEYVLTYTV